MENSIDVIFNDYDEDDNNLVVGPKLWKSGDVLFRLTPSESGLKIKWDKMQPQLNKNLDESIFKKIDK